MLVSMLLDSFLRSESLVSRRYVTSLSPRARGGPSDKRLKRQKRKGGRVFVDLVKLARIVKREGLGA